MSPQGVHRHRCEWGPAVAPLLDHRTAEEVLTTEPAAPTPSRGARDRVPIGAQVRNCQHDRACVAPSAYRGCPATRGAATSCKKVVPPLIWPTDRDEQRLIGTGALNRTSRIPGDKEILAADSDHHDAAVDLQREATNFVVVAPPTRARRAG